MVTSRPYYACRSYTIDSKPPSFCLDLKFSTNVQSSEISCFSIECSPIVQSFSGSCPSYFVQVSQNMGTQKIGAPSESGWSKGETPAVSEQSKV